MCAATVLLRLFEWETTILPGLAYRWIFTDNRYADISADILAQSSLASFPQKRQLQNIPFTYTEANVANWLQHKMVSECWLRHTHWCP